MPTDIVAQIFAIETPEDARSLLPTVEAYLDDHPTDRRVRRALEMLLMMTDESGDEPDTPAEPPPDPTQFSTPHVTIAWGWNAERLGHA